MQACPPAHGLLLSNSQFSLRQKTKFTLTVTRQEFSQLVHQQLINPRKSFVPYVTGNVLSQTTRNTKLTENELFKNIKVRTVDFANLDN